MLQSRFGFSRRDLLEEQVGEDVVGSPLLPLSQHEVTHTALRSSPCVCIHTTGMTKETLTHLVLKLLKSLLGVLSSRRGEAVLPQQQRTELLGTYLQLLHPPGRWQALW